MSGEQSICLADLSTENGIVAVAVKMAETVRDDLLLPLLEHTPKEMRQALFERFFSALTGVMCAEIGPELAVDTLEAVKDALVEIHAKRSATH